MGSALPDLAASCFRRRAAAALIVIVAVFVLLMLLYCEVFGLFSFHDRSAGGDDVVFCKDRRILTALTPDEVEDAERSHSTH